MGNEHDPHLHTISKTLEPSSTSKALVSTLTAAEKGRVAVMLTALSSHYWRPDFSPAQAAALIADYCEDLADCRLDELDVAIREYRRGDHKFFPKIGQLREIVFENRKHRHELAKLGAPLRHVKTRPIFWWSQSRKLWNSEWQESEVPAGALVRDAVTGKLREPIRA